MESFSNIPSPDNFTLSLCGEILHLVVTPAGAVWLVSGGDCSYNFNWFVEDHTTSCTHLYMQVAIRDIHSVTHHLSSRAIWPLTKKLGWTAFYMVHWIIILFRLLKSLNLLSAIKGSINVYGMSVRTNNFIVASYNILPCTSWQYSTKKTALFSFH